MRSNNHSVKLAVASLFVGGLAVAAVSHAAPQRLAVENNVEYLTHLRAERHSLADVKAMLDKEDMADRANHRHDAIDHLGKAINSMDAEIAEYDKDMKNGK